MFNTLRKLSKIIQITKIQNVFLLFIFICINALVELISLGILIPFVTLIIEPNFFNDFQLFLNNQKFYNFSYFLNLSRKDFILSLITLMIIFFMFRFFVNIFYVWYLNSKKVEYDNIISIKILSNISKINYSSYLNISSSELINNITGRVPMVTGSIVALANIMVEILILSVISIILFFEFPSKSAIIISITLLIFLLINIFYRKFIVLWSIERGKGGDLRTQNLVDFFLGIREVIIYSLQNFFIKDFLSANKKFLNSQKKILIFNSLPRIIIEFLLSLIFLGFFFYTLTNNFLTNDIILSASIILILSLRIFPSFNRILFNFNTMKYGTESIYKISNFLVSTEKNFIDKKDVTFKKKIQIKNLSFGFTKDFTILENLNFEILKNKKIGISGESGSGKTTFIDILTGLLKPTKGDISVDEINIYDANVSSWIKKISFIQQKVFIFNSSLRQNITLVNDNQMIDKKKLDKILELSDLKNFVNSKQNLELFNVGEFGNNLSGGQKQKVGLARALYQDSEILILDESTNAIDEVSERKIIENILSLNDKTIIFITHNLKNLVNFDETFKFEQKKLVKY